MNTSVRLCFVRATLKGKNNLKPRPQNKILAPLGISFKISDKHPCHLHMGLPHTTPLHLHPLARYIYHHVASFPPRWIKCINGYLRQRSGKSNMFYCTITQNLKQFLTHHFCSVLFVKTMSQSGLPLIFLQDKTSASLNLDRGFDVPETVEEIYLWNAAQKCILTFYNWLPSRIYTQCLRSSRRIVSRNES